MKVKILSNLTIKAHNSEFQIKFEKDDEVIVNKYSFDTNGNLNYEVPCGFKYTIPRGFYEEVKDE